MVRLQSTTRDDQEQEQQQQEDKTDEPYQHDLSVMEQLAREWSAMNKDDSSSSSTTTSKSSSTTSPPTPPPPQENDNDTTTSTTSAESILMDQLAREWTARNRDDLNPDEPLPLPEDAMSNLPPQQGPFRFATPPPPPATRSSTAFRGQDSSTPVPPMTTPTTTTTTTSSSPLPHMDDSSATMPDLVSESLEINSEESEEESISNDKYVFVGGDSRRLDQDPDLRMVMSEASVWKYFRKERPSFFGKLPLSLLIDRTWDTVEDILVHVRRIPYEKGWVDLTEAQEASRKTVVVLGSGWAAHALMKVADCNKLRLIIVSPSNHFVFTPMLASAAVGTVEYRSMTEAVRAANPMICDYLEGAATSVNVPDQTVTVQMNPLHEVAKSEQLSSRNDDDDDDDESESSAMTPPILTIPYDHLVVAVGSKVDDRGVPGANACLRLKTTEDAKRLRTAVGQALEYASRPNLTDQERQRRITMLIVGGGPTGVELAGELHDLFVDVTRPHKGTYPRLMDAYQVILVHGGPDLVPQFEPALRKEALLALEKKGVQVILNTRVTNVGETEATLSTKVLDDITGQATGERTESIVPMGLAVWCAGTAPVPFVEQLLQQLPEQARNRDGRVSVDGWMRPPMVSDDLLGSVLVVGDAAAVQDDPAESSSGGRLLPATAQVAGQQGAFVARLLDRNYDLTTTPPQLHNFETSHADEEAAAVIAQQWGDHHHDHGQEMDDQAYDVFDDPALNLWLRFRGLEHAPSFGFLNLGMLAYLGGGEALSQVQVGQFPILAWAGSVAFVLWRSVYLVKQVATRNRVLVTFDWIKSSMFGRDTTRL